MFTTSVHTASKPQVQKNTNFMARHGLKVRAGLMALSSAIAIFSLILLFQFLMGDTSEKPNEAYSSSDQQTELAQ